MSSSTFLRRPRRGDAPPSDIQKGSPAEVGAGIVQCLRVKGYCVIRDTITDETVEKAMPELEAAEWYQPAVVVQEGLLGIEGSSRIARMAPSEHDSAASGEGLGAIDYVMWRLTEAIGPYQDEIGFRCSTRSYGFLHQANEPDIDEVDLTDNEANDWCSLFSCRKIMILVFLGPGKGTLELQPYDEEANATELTTIPGLVVAVRTDQLSFKYYNRGRVSTYVASCFMLQPDLLRLHRNKLEEHLVPAARELDAWIDARLKEIKDDQPDEPDWDEVAIPRNFIAAANRTYFKRTTTAVRGASARHPVTWEPEVFFLSLIAGADTIIEVPIMRWEHSDVYDAAPNGWQQNPPKTSCKHAGFIDGVDLFDNKMFGLSLAEVKGMDPSQRVVLEVCYDALHRSGMKKSTLINSTCGMYVGTSSTEWNYAERSADVGIFGATGGAPSIMAGRLSFCLGCKGASLAVDTEAASGLSSVYWAAESVEKKGVGHIQDLACGIGVHLILSKAWWPAHSAAGFLCPGGRCFAFDSSAAGHVRCEGVGTVVVRAKAQTIDGEEVSDNTLPLVGTIVGGATSNSGRSAGMTAPSGPAEQAVLLEACRKTGIMPFDVDVIECHGTGRFIADAVEVASCGKALRDGADESVEVLHLCSHKTNIGHTVEESGITGLVKAMHAIRWGILPANIHMRQLNPHLDLQGVPILLADETLEQRNNAVFVGVSSHGFGGTNVHLHLYGGVDEEMRPPPQPTPEEYRPKLTYWPAGGGDLGSMNRPRKGFFIVGTFNSWSEPVQMEDEGDNVYGYTLTLGENRWEQFQIQIDGSDAKVLHPNGYKAPKGSQVHGPSRQEEIDRNSTWLLDGRADPPAPMPALTSGSDDVLSKTTGDEVVVFGAEDKGQPGDRYRVRLHIAGKWRTVTWAKVQAEASGALALPAGASSRYYLAGNWNDWELDEMAADESTPGLYTAEVLLTRTGGEFQIVRNRDWQQTLYPMAERATPETAIHGPDDRYDSYSWFLGGVPGDRFKVEFQRTTEEGTDKKKVSWRKLPPS